MPVINPEYLSNEVDVDIMIRASRRMGEAAATPPFSNFLTPTAFAQSGMPALNATDEEWRVWMLETSVYLIFCHGPQLGYNRLSYLQISARSSFHWK